MGGRYRALLIGNSTYLADEHNLQPLKGPVKDIAVLNRALVDADNGLFSKNRPRARMALVAVASGSRVTSTSSCRYVREIVLGRLRHWCLIHPADRFGSRGACALGQTQIAVAVHAALRYLLACFA
jgi:hypothetical protein